jgi:hypothetical protein
MNSLIIQMLIDEEGKNTRMNYFSRECNALSDLCHCGKKTSKQI